MPDMSDTCPHCGLIHKTTCARIKAIEYQPDGVTVKRVEFHGLPPVVVSDFNVRDMGSFFQQNYNKINREGCNIPCGEMECSQRGCKRARERSSHIPRGAGTG